TADQRLETRSKDLENSLAQMGLERLENKPFQEAVNAVDEDAVGADDDERESPSLKVRNIADRVTGGENQEAPAAAVKRPRGRPNPFDHGAQTQPTGGKSD